MNKTIYQVFLAFLLGVAVAGSFPIFILLQRGAQVEIIGVPSPAPILIQIGGAVNHPGVYQLHQGARVEDALQAAGGLSAQANSNAVNLVARLKDGDMIIIPSTQTPGPPAQPISSSSLGQPTGSLAGCPVNLNTSGIEDLEMLPGIGPTRAQQIIDYRNANGSFHSIDDLLNVPGIGPSTFERLKDCAAVD